VEALIAGPFLLTRDSGKLPPGLITVSPCLANVAPDCWAIEWSKTPEAERLACAAEFGIDARDLPNAIRWATDHFDAGGFLWPNMFLDAATAREFRRRFVRVTVRLLQIALPEDMLEPFLALTAPPPQQPGYAPVGAVGVHQALSHRSVLANTGESRGFEVLGFDGAAGFDSFRCNALDKDFQRLFGINFNQWGLIDDATEARRCAEYANGPEVSTCAVAWHPWLVTEHVI
jgi:hypothetical protein